MPASAKRPQSPAIYDAPTFKYLNLAAFQDIKPQAFSIQQFRAPDWPVYISAPLGPCRVFQPQKAKHHPTPWSSDLRFGRLHVTPFSEIGAKAPPPSAQNAVAGIVGART